MNKLIMFFLTITYSLLAQDFIVKKVTGDAKYLRGMSETWEDITEGQILKTNDLILTEKRSLVQLQRDSELFVLTGDAAIGLNHIREISLNDLILALTLDEIRSVPKKDGKDISRNTAVYGTESSNDEEIVLNEKILGRKKINGAKQLKDNGYLESSIILAKEIFRNYPDISANLNDRLFFAELLTELELYEEAVEDYQLISYFNISDDEKKNISERIEYLSLKIIENK